MNTGFLFCDVSLSCIWREPFYSQAADEGLLSLILVAGQRALRTVRFTDEGPSSWEGAPAGGAAVRPPRVQSTSGL